MTFVVENYSNVFLLLSLSILFSFFRTESAFESNYFQFEGKYGVTRYKVRNKVCLFISILHAYKRRISYFAARYAVIRGF